MILMTSANGKTGRHVIPLLAAKGEKVRALDISERAVELKSLGAFEVVIGDALDAATLEKAVKGVKAVVHVGPPFHPQETEMGKAVIDAARSAGVWRFVYFSVTHSQIGALFNHKVKLAVEEYLINSDLNYTILQPMHYMQNIRIPDAIRDGVVRQMYNLDRRLSHVDMADAAEAAAKVLTEDGHYGATYELCGEPTDYISANEVAGIISKVSGKTVRAELLSLDAFLSSDRAAHMGDYQKQGMRRLFEYYGEHGIFGNPNVLTWLLGRRPTTFEEYVRREMRRH